MVTKIVYVDYLNIWVNYVCSFLNEYTTIKFEQNPNAFYECLDIKLKHFEYLKSG